MVNAQNVVNGKNAKNAVVAAQQPAAPVSAPAASAPATVQFSAPVAASAPAALHTVVQHTPLRAARLAAVYKVYRTRALAARKQASATATQAHLQNALLQQVQALYAAAGLQAPTQALRAVPVQQKHPQSTITNVCATIRAWVHANPQATRKQAIAHFTGSANPATVSTQYQRAKSGIA